MNQVELQPGSVWREGRSVPFTNEICGHPRARSATTLSNIYSKAGVGSRHKLTALARRNPRAFGLSLIGV